MDFTGGFAVGLNSRKVRKGPNFIKKVENQEILKPLFIILVSSLFQNFDLFTASLAVLVYDESTGEVRFWKSVSSQKVDETSVIF